VATNNPHYGKYVVPALFIAGLTLSIFILKPFIVSLLASAIIAYIFYPVFLRVQKYVKNKTASAAIVSLLILLLITIPIIVMVNTLTRDAYSLYLSSKSFLASGNILDQCSLQICSSAKEWLGGSQVQAYLHKGLEVATTYLLSNASSFVGTIARRFVEVFITFFAVFYLLRDGEKLTDSIKRIILTRYGKKQHIVKRFNEVMYAVVFGALLIALIQGSLGAIGFALFGISSPITWGVIMFFLALIPSIGTGLIWVPASIILVLTGFITSDMTSIWKGVGLFIYGLLIVGSIDNILKPKIIGDRSRVHPVLVLTGTLGGLALMGIAGIVVGPAVIAMTLTFIELYIEKK
jgi:predicted PurR-regulated permease PerM